MTKRVGVIAFLVLLFGIAHATHPGGSTGYALLGFSADGKYAFFEKRSSYIMKAETWLAVYDGSNAKLASSQPVYRNCNPMNGEPDDPSRESAPGGMQDPGCGTEIGKKTGAKTSEKIHKTYGTVDAKTKLVAKNTPDQEAATNPKSPGQVQTFTGAGVEVKVRSKLTSSKLPDPMDSSPNAGFDLEVTVTAGATKWSAKHRLYVDPTQDVSNGNIYRWETLYVQDLAVAPGNKAVAFVFCRKPVVLVPKK